MSGADISDLGGRGPRCSSRVEITALVGKLSNPPPGNGAAPGVAGTASVEPHYWEERAAAVRVTGCQHQDSPELLTRGPRYQEQQALSPTFPGAQPFSSSPNSVAFPASSGRAVALLPRLGIAWFSASSKYAPTAGPLRSLLPQPALRTSCLSPASPLPPPVRSGVTSGAKASRQRFSFLHQFPSRCLKCTCVCFLSPAAPSLACLLGCCAR